jgi:hypothetical protein
MDNPQQIALSLGENIKEAVRGLFNNNYKSWDNRRMSDLWRGLGKRGFNELKDLGLAQKTPPWELTSLGRDVYPFISEKES